MEARSRDVGIDFDPYCTHLGPSETAQAVVVVIVVLATLAPVRLAVLMPTGD